MFTGLAPKWGPGGGSAVPVVFLTKQTMKFITIILLAISSICHAQDWKIGPSASADISARRSVMFGDEKHEVKGLTVYNYFGVSAEFKDRVVSVQYGPLTNSWLLSTHILFRIKKKKVPRA